MAIFLFSGGELLRQRTKQPDVKHPQVEQKAGLRGCVCPYPPVTLSSPTSTPAGAKASATCSISTSTCSRSYAVTHSSSSQWKATWQKVCMLELQTHSCTVSFYRSITLVVVPLCMPDKSAKVGSLLAWESALKWGKYLALLSSISSLHQAVDTRSQSALSV